MKTAQKIDLKRQELDHLRHAIRDTLGPRSTGGVGKGVGKGLGNGVGLGIVFAGFALGIMVERWGWRPTIGNAFSVNRLVSMLIPVLAPVMAPVTAPVTGLLHS